MVPLTPRSREDHTSLYQLAQRLTVIRVRKHILHVGKGNVATILKNRPHMVFVLCTRSEQLEPPSDLGDRGQRLSVQDRLDRFQVDLPDTPEDEQRVTRSILLQEPEDELGHHFIRTGEIDDRDFRKIDQRQRRPAALGHLRPCTPCTNTGAVMSICADALQSR